MKAQTIHSNALGDVLNESTASGFRITDNKGRSCELRVKDGMVYLLTPRGRNKILVGVMDEPTKLCGVAPTSILLDEVDHS